MTFRTERCAVGENAVTLVTDFEGTITMVMCPDFEYASGACTYRRRRADSGPLTDYIARVSTLRQVGQRPRCIYSTNPK